MGLALPELSAVSEVLSRTPAVVRPCNPVQRKAWGMAISHVEASTRTPFLLLHNLHLQPDYAFLILVRTPKLPRVLLTESRDRRNSLWALLS